MGEIGSAEWIVVAATAALVALAVVFHYEVIAWLNRWVHRRVTFASLGHPNRRNLLAVLFALLFAHVVEIWLFAAGYWALARTGDYGAILGYEQWVLFDYVYFSAATYTTVGWGDLAPVGPIRFLAGTEALAGFMLITWSASFTYLIMARTWGTSDEEQL